MSARYPRFDVVQTDHGFTVRFIATNGANILSSSRQTYGRRADALRAVEIVAETFGGFLHSGAIWTYVDDVGRIGRSRILRVEVRDIDARTGATP